MERFELNRPIQYIREIQAPKLITTIPLNLWFAEVSKTDMWDAINEFQYMAVGLVIRKVMPISRTQKQWTNPSPEEKNPKDLAEKRYYGCTKITTWNKIWQ